MICREPSDVPVAPHYAILKFSSVYIPGDERSQSNPGHGYPAETITTIDYWQTSDRAKWVQEIAKEIDARRPFKAIHVDVVAVPTVKVMVDV